ncbi:MAG TPA: zf-HC2 domain-containing protein, partial [Thermoanaerobaculia bacterium]|nr:zf-HC2 domain-containing protein [Thermoanaerobaculia bacterium]
MGFDAHTHEQLERLLPWYVNGTLEAGERAALEAHLAACARCRGEVAREEGLAAALRGAEDVAPA